MPVIAIMPDVYWIGVNDRTKDLFEGLWPITNEGVSYNSYLINDEKKALIDLTKSSKGDEYLAQIDEGLLRKLWMERGSAEGGEKDHRAFEVGAC